MLRRTRPRIGAIENAAALSTNFVEYIDPYRFLELPLWQRGWDDDGAGRRDDDAERAKARGGYHRRRRFGCRRRLSPGTLRRAWSDRLSSNAHKARSRLAYDTLDPRTYQCSGSRMSPRRMTSSSFGAGSLRTMPSPATTTRCPPMALLRAAACSAPMSRHGAAPFVDIDRPWERVVEVGRHNGRWLISAKVACSSRRIFCHCHQPSFSDAPNGLQQASSALASSHEGGCSRQSAI